MLNMQQRSAILELHAKGIPQKQIARTLKISLKGVKKVLRSQSYQPPAVIRAEKAEPYRQQILDLVVGCKGNLVRVHEEIVAAGADLSYPALTAFCRRHGIGQEPKVPSGRYDFPPGKEMQHDTSPHEALIGGKKRKVQSASAALCYSHMLFFQGYPSFQRFDCKVFLNDALGYYGGVPEDVMIDFVAGNKIDLLCPIGLCGRQAIWDRKHTVFSENSAT